MLTVARWRLQTVHVSEIEIYMSVPQHLMTSFEALENGRKAILETNMTITAVVCVQINVSITAASADNRNRFFEIHNFLGLFHCNLIGLK